MACAPGGCLGSARPKSSPAALVLIVKSVLLGSLASRKYFKILSPIFGRRLIVPAEFIGRGDMSRGAYARENRELSCVDGTILTAGKMNRTSDNKQAAKVRKSQE